MCRVCQCGYYCFQIQSGNGTRYCLSLCALYCVLHCKPLTCWLLWGHLTLWLLQVLRTRSKLEGLQNQRDLRLAREGTQILQSRHAMKWWHSGQILHLLSSLWPPVGRPGIWSGEEEGVMQVNGLPHARGLGALQSTCSGLCTTWHQGNDDRYISEDVGSLTSNWVQPWPPCTSQASVSQAQFFGKCRNPTISMEIRDLCHLWKLLFVP